MFVIYAVCGLTSRGGIAMRPLGLSRGSRRLVRTVSNGGRSAKTRFRPSTSRGRGRALTLVRGIEILELLGLCAKTARLPGRVTRSGKDGKPRSSLPGRSSQRDRASPGRGSQRDRRTPSPKSPRRQSPAGPADRSFWEYAKTGKCQFEHDKSPCCSLYSEDW